jgi:predicted DNA-binding transcriptional regulator YafY
MELSIAQPAQQPHPDRDGLRNDFRHFRVDRILASDVLDERFAADSGRLTTEWLALRKDRASASA